VPILWPSRRCSHRSMRDLLLDASAKLSVNLRQNEEVDLTYLTASLLDVIAVISLVAGRCDSISFVI
jgi:hypothetical protein